HDSVQSIDAVELNPALVELVGERYAAYSGNLYGQANVAIHIGNARAFIASRAAQYDLIQFGLPDSMTGSGGLHALGENYLYTVESIRTLLRRLAPNGYLAITLWTRIPPRDTLKMFATAIQALKDLGVSSPNRQLILIRSWQTSTLIVKNGMIDEHEINQSLAFCEELSFDPVFFPGIQATETNRRNRVLEDYFFLGSQALLGAHSDDFQRDYKFNIRPATDDRPYFFDFFKWRSVPEIIESLYSGGMSLLEGGYLILIASLFQAMLASLILIVAPLLWLRKRSAAIPFQSVRGPVFGYFFSLGMAFMFLEIALIQKFILFLYHPLYSATTILTAILLFAGIGSLWSQRFDTRKKRCKAVFYSCIAIIGLSVLFIYLLNPLFAGLIALPQFAKFAIAVLLVAPLGFCMGIPFPLGLSVLDGEAPWTLAWAWGINGSASVISAILASLLAIQFGFSVLMFFAGLLYAIVALRFSRLIPVHGSPALAAPDHEARRSEKLS
ncbi:MAG: SAM-dependent methyltransferase, partial [Methylococcales bacterium]